MRLADITSQLETGKVAFRGGEIPVRAISSQETFILQRIKRKPVAPMGPDQSKGSGAPYVPWPQEADYQARLADWYLDITLLEVAAGLSWAPVGGIAWSESITEAEAAAWAPLAIAELRGKARLTEAEISKIYKKMQELAGADTIEAAVKNSSGPQATTVPAGPLPPAGSTSPSQG